MKPFDERFADKVREVFDQHEEAFDEAAWIGMKKRLIPKKKSRMVILWPFLSRAAVVLVLLAGMTFLYTRFFYLPEHDLADRRAGSSDRLRQELAAGEGAMPADTLPVADPGVPGAVQDWVAMSSPAVADGRPLSSEAGGAVSRQIPVKDEPAPEVPGRASDVAGLVVETLVPQADKAGEVLQVRPATDTAPVETAEVALESHETTTAEIADVVERTGYPDYVPVPPVTSSGQGREGNNWSLVAGSMMTFAEQQLAGGIGFTGGMLHEWRASDRIRVSSGLMLAYQQFEVDGMPLRYSIGKSSLDMAPESFSVRTVGNQAYEMLAIDIPLNVQLRLAEQRNKRLYVSAGISSLLYLQQHVSGTEIAYVQAEVYDQQYATNRTLSYASEVSVDASYGAFQSFDPARLLNLSFGYEIHGKRHAAVIEPFIKYPLGTLSSRHIKMGMGGLSLRYRFDP